MISARPKTAKRLRWAANANAWLLLLPALVLLATFTHYPILATLYHSFFSLGRSGPATFVGIENYQAMLEDDVFWQVLRNNLVFALATVPASIALALLMAVWVDRKITGRSFLRLAFFTPTVLPMIAVANIWLFFYTPDYGLLDQILRFFGFSGHNWLGDPGTVMTCLIVMVVWKEAGFFMIFYLAALQTIPPELKEAASVEGAGRWYFFRRVTLPLLMPTTLFISINALINSFKLVDQLVIMTKGGPNNASSLLLYYIYEVAFNFWDTTYAATLTVTLIAILAVIAITKFVYLDRRIHYQ
ncbi:carbohydrate ABC transporter permease [Microvirga pudoricolor]|uniref:carbohydrate ABC transporter permease n=1 Tax=Microvirga pudoricolor TaxID=2778729 RepID=UPI00194E0B46|nr:sugar ABC transporter permease [Microvirga pudoricolor]MBM6593217.1 sugar ABC transporter permease [Microvirga pudoricolor]